MRTSIRSVIPFNKGLILIHRIRKENETLLDYYVFPGGGLEENESIDECLIRELKEEVGIDIRVIKQLYEVMDTDRKEFFYLCQYIKGNIGSGTGPEFTNKEYAQRGSYECKIVEMSVLKDINLLPEDICNKWLSEYKNYIE
jgi:8-oxo-dGTP pyrophosphatase MutT (NUDIX family)